MTLHRSLLIMACMLISIPLLAESYSGTREDPYPLEVFWKKDGDKMAVFCKSKISEEIQLTDFIFDTDCKESFGKGKNVNFLDASDCYGILDHISRKGKFLYIRRVNGIVPVKVNGRYNLLVVKARISPEKDDWRVVFPEGYDTWEIAATYDKYLSGNDKLKKFYIYVTRGDSNHKGLLSIDRLVSRRDAVVLDCEYDEIIPADNGNIDKEKGKLKWNYNPPNRPMFITRKGNRWGAVLDPYDVVPPLYDLKSFTRTEQYDDERPMRTPYLIRRVSWSLVAVERGDTLILANEYKDLPFTNHRPGEIPPFEEWKIADFEGEYTPASVIVFDAPDNMAAYNVQRHHFIPHKGSTYDIRSFLTFTSDTLSTYILSGKYGCKLYNADLGKELISDATSIAPIPGSNGFLSVSLPGDSRPKAAFLTRDYSEAVILDSMEELPAIAKTTGQTGTTRILDYEGNAGLYDLASGFALPCVYDSIVPVASIVDSIPDVIGRLFLAYKNKKFGIVGSSAPVMGKVFDKIKRSPDGRGIMLDADVYNSPDSYILEIKCNDEGNLTFDDNLDKIFQNLFVKADKEDVKYDHTIDYLLLGMFEFAAHSDRPELLPRIYQSGAMIAINTALATSDKRTAMEMLDKADELHLHAVIKSETELPDLDLPGIRERLIEYFRQQDIARAEAEATRQREAELQAQAQAEAQARQRQERAQAWAQLADALGQLGQGISNAIGNYQASKASTRAAASAPRRPATVHQSTASSSSSSSAPAQRNRAADFFNRKNFERAYDTAKGIVMKYYYGQYAWNLREVQKAQESMRDTRAKAQKQGFTIYKSDFEDITAPYRK